MTGNFPEDSSSERPSRLRTSDGDGDGGGRGGRRPRFSPRQRAEAMQPSVDPFLAAKTVARRQMPARWRSGRTTAAGCVFLATRLSALPTSRPPVRLIYRLCRASLVYARGVVEKELGPLCIASPRPRPPSFAARPLLSSPLRLCRVARNDEQKEPTTSSHLTLLNSASHIIHPSPPFSLPLGAGSSAIDYGRGARRRRRAPPPALAARAPSPAFLPLPTGE